MLNEYIIPVAVFAVTGLTSGVLLTAASKIFEVKTDERTEKISEILPQANCGSCGYAGCADYADAIISKGEKTNLCRPGGTETAKKISEITGSDAGEVTETYAAVLCRGDCSAADTKYVFAGIHSCASVKRYYAGNSTCAYGCAGYGDCAAVCGYNAVSIENSVAHIDPELCRGCGSCAKVCPKGLIALIPRSKGYTVLCSSRDNGKATKLACKNGCIGCRMCEKACKHEAVTVTDFHASIDPSKCTGCGSCAEKCPVGAIRKINCTE
ncbi:RnfABCDGE type electron transport complex subunit B [Ruminococcus sp. HUN007]|uniref:RnfABCDGE type electron transport complex subunit B n=1 Tax=Ruminococcus sp. HUN007 TaxID=1514668 RepID=UPI0005D17866|nr:RnfABCDGE type electron transport complex subunit B [Ruminococcus sp. HUN007]